MDSSPRRYDPRPGVTYTPGSVELSPAALPDARGGTFPEPAVTGSGAFLEGVGNLHHHAKDIAA